MAGKDRKRKRRKKKKKGDACRIGNRCERRWRERLVNSNLDLVTRALYNKVVIRL